MGVGCTWEISVPSAQFCFQPETEVKGKFAQSCQTLHPHGLQPARLLCPWNSPSKNTGVNSCSILQGIFPTQVSNPGLLHCRQILYHLSHQGKPKNTGVSLSLLQKMFLTQGQNHGLLHCRQILYHLSHQGKPKNTGVSLSFLQEIFLTQGYNHGLLHCRQVLYQLSYQGSPMV